MQTSSSFAAPTLTYVEKMRMVLAEAGYPNAHVEAYNDEATVALSGDRAVPDFECWKAHRIVGETTTPCFKCWCDGTDDECCDGRCPNA